MNFSQETSLNVIEFLRKNVLISIKQEQELLELGRKKKETALNILLKLYPENEEKICEIIQHIYKLPRKKIKTKETFKYKKINNFFYGENKKKEKFFITYDPQLIIDYFNYLLPNTLIVSLSEFKKISETKNLKNLGEKEISLYTINSKNIEIKDINYLGEKTLSEEEINEDAVKQLDRIIQDSISKDSSDIHIEVDSKSDGNLFYRVRYRIDGSLETNLENNNLEVYFGLLSQIKLKSGLKIDENRLPQDGRLNYSILGKIYSFRVSTKPVVVHNLNKNATNTSYEKIVIRKMPDVNEINLESLGYHPYNLDLLKESSLLANGFNIVTGPTGSGKTTLLYAILRQIDTKKKNVSTIEDPVEAELKKINQTQVLSDIGLNFARVLRAELRQDPDIIMVGEMRDKETAEIAAEASLTGHLVFSTLHTKNAVSSITRLINMGLPPFIVSSALSFCIAQRLVKKLCPNCKIKAEKENNDKSISKVIKKCKNKNIKKILEKAEKKGEVYKENKQGCKECAYSGFKGRTAILEIYKLNDESEEIIQKHNANEIMLQEHAEKTGMMNLEQDGILKVLNGEISLEELYTVLVKD
jgi:type II secretory ATPase GspE/PulE/Tfp pilus assembly ATPase PilB-like protein